MSMREPHLSRSGAGHSGLMNPAATQPASFEAWQAVVAPGDVFRHPREVLAHPLLSREEKRTILASWISDACALESAPGLRCLTGARAEPVTVDALLAALAELDGPATPENAAADAPPARATPPAAPREPAPLSPPAPSKQRRRRAAALPGDDYAPPPDAAECRCDPGLNRGRRSPLATPLSGCGERRGRADEGQTDIARVGRVPFVALRLLEEGRPHPGRSRRAAAATVFLGAEVIKCYPP